MPENIPLTDILSGGTNSLRTEITNTPAVTNANLNIQLSALRDAITKTGETVKTLADVVDKLSDVGITSLPSLIAGSNIVGKVGIDQTTGGITNGVVNKNASGNEIFTNSNPGSMQLTGSLTGKGAIATVTTAGTRVQLPSFPCRLVTVIAKRTNTGYIYASPDNLVSSTVYGVELAAKDSFDFEVANANQIWIDSSVNGEGISYVAI